MSDSEIVKLINAMLLDYWTYGAHNGEKAKENALFILNVITTVVGYKRERKMKNA
jgi:hypothetical protein